MQTTLSNWQKSPYFDAGASAGEELAVFAIQKVSDCIFPGRVQFTIGLMLASCAPGCGLHFITRTTIRTPIGKARLAGFQFKLLSTNGAGFDGEGHCPNDTSRIRGTLKVLWQG